MGAFQTILSPTLGVLEIAGAVSGVPCAQGASMALQIINTACSQVAIHKRKSAQLADRCNSLLNLINEHSVGPACDEMRPSLEEAEFVLYAVRDRLQKWSQYSKVKRFLKSSQIENDLDKCQHDVNTVMERLHVRNPLSVMILQKKSMDIMQMHQSRLEEKLEQLMISPQQVRDAAQQHSAGGQDALNLMKTGQERLIQLQLQSPLENTLSPEQVFEGPIVESPVASRSSSLELMVQAQIQSALTELRCLTKIPPTLKVLNNQVNKISSSTPLRSGTYCDIWPGEWLGEAVALKSLRILTDPQKAGRMTRRYEHEMDVWSKLKHNNILSVYGVITNLETIYVVSTWQDNGNVLEYRIKNPDINPLILLAQAAKGIEYLHGNNIVHGNLKCNNILVSSEGVACISDFGHTQVLDDVLGRDVVTSYTGTSNARWSAPELLGGGDDVRPTKASDVFAFGMSILELITRRAPYSHRKRDLTVIKDVNDGRLPLCPVEPEDAARWMHDELWGVLNECWCFAAQERLSIEHVTICLETLAEYLAEHPNWRTEESNQIEVV